MATWVLNDETKVNSYGFRLLNSGMDLSRFKENAVMLAMHKDWDLTAVIGRWINIRIEGSVLLADDDFDLEDEEAKKIAGKAKRGFLKGASLGFLFQQEYFEKALDGVFELSQSEPYEGSIVVIPSNKSAVRLYAAPGVLLTPEEIKLQLSAMSEVAKLLITDTKPILETDMEKFTLSGPALAVLLTVGLMAQNDPAAVNASIAQLGADLKAAKDGEAAAKLALQTMKDAKLTAAKETATATVEAAILEGKLTADKRESFITLGINDPGMLATVLGSMPGKTTLGKQVAGNPHGGAGDPKNLEEFEKLTLSKQLAFKSENPEGYRALFS